MTLRLVLTVKIKTLKTHLLSKSFNALYMNIGVCLCKDCFMLGTLQTQTTHTLTTAHRHSHCFFVPQSFFRFLIFLLNAHQVFPTQTCAVRGHIVTICIYDDRLIPLVDRITVQILQMHNQYDCSKEHYKSQRPTLAIYIFSSRHL